MTMVSDDGMLIVTMMVVGGRNDLTEDELVIVSQYGLYWGLAKAGGNDEASWARALEMMYGEYGAGGWPFKLESVR